MVLTIVLINDSFNELIKIIFFNTKACRRPRLNYSIIKSIKYIFSLNSNKKITKI